MTDNNNTQGYNKEDETNGKLISKKLTVQDLKSHLNLRYVDYREAGVKAGISEGRVRQILIGYSIPISSKLINQIAKGWDIEPVKLALLFENLRNNPIPENKEKVEGRGN